MNLKEFIKKWTNKPVDFDGIYPNQCMDLMHQYVYEVLGITDKSVLAAPSAYMVYANFRWGNLFKQIKNTPLAVPKEGDIIVWGQGLGVHGHIAVFVEGDIMSFKSFDANWPIGSLPHVQHHDYTHVLGWLRPITTCGELEDKLEKVTTEKNKYKAEARDLRETKEKNEAEIKHLANSLTGVNDLYKKLIEEDKVEDAQMRELIKNHEQLSTDYKQQVDRNFTLDKSNVALTKENKELKDEVRRLHDTQLNFSELLHYLISWLVNLIGGVFDAISKARTTKQS